MKLPIQHQRYNIPVWEIEQEDSDTYWMQVNKLIMKVFVGLVDELGEFYFRLNITGKS